MTNLIYTMLIFFVVSFMHICLMFIFCCLHLHKKTNLPIYNETSCGIKTTSVILFLTFCNFIIHIHTKISIDFILRYIVHEYTNYHIRLIYKKVKCKVMALKIRSSCICCLKTTVSVC